jgi:hypothetical protein
MKLADEIRIRTQPEEVWPHVGDPKGWLGFHPKVATVRQTAGSGPAVDAWYEIEFEMNGHSLLHRARVVEFEPFRRLRLEAICTGHQGQELEVDMLYEIEPVGDGVRVCERFDIRNHGIPWPFTLLISWIHRTGRPQGKTGLEQLRELLEHQAVPA